MKMIQVGPRNNRLPLRPAARGGCDARLGMVLSVMTVEFFF